MEVSSQEGTARGSSPRGEPVKVTETIFSRKVVRFLHERASELVLHSTEGCRDGKAPMCGGLREARTGGGGSPECWVHGVFCAF